jgi:hypothetical protein
VFTRFVYRPNWFVLAQTDGQELPPTLPPSWNRVQALAKLEIDEVPFDLTDGNCLGFARKRQIAISPVNPMPHKTLFHEVAHVLLDAACHAKTDGLRRDPTNSDGCPIVLTG